MFTLQQHSSNVLKSWAPDPKLKRKRSISGPEASNLKHRKSASGNQPITCPSPVRSDDGRDKMSMSIFLLHSRSCLTFFLREKIARATPRPQIKFKGSAR